MANSIAVAVNNRNWKRFEYMQEKLLAGIDRRARAKEADEDIMSKHFSGTTEEGERTWTFD